MRIGVLRRGSRGRCVMFITHLHKPRIINSELFLLVSSIMTLGAKYGVEIALFWHVTERRLLVSCRRFGTTYQSHIQESINPRRMPGVESS